jgi:hypothetical protein
MALAILKLGCGGEMTVCVRWLDVNLKGENGAHRFIYIKFCYGFLYLIEMLIDQSVTSDVLIS